MFKLTDSKISSAHHKQKQTRLMNSWITRGIAVAIFAAVYLTLFGLGGAPSDGAHDSFDVYDFCDKACKRAGEDKAFNCPMDDKACLLVATGKAAADKCDEICMCMDYCDDTYREQIIECHAADSIKCISTARHAFNKCSSTCPQSLEEARLKSAKEDQEK